MTEPGWMYRTHFWPEGEGRTVEQWRQGLLEEGWEVWTPGLGCWALANQRRRFGVSLRRQVARPFATPPR